MDTAKKHRGTSGPATGASESSHASKSSSQQHQDALTFVRRDLTKAHQQDKKEFFSNVAAGVAHEINNLLVGAIGAANLATKNTAISAQLQEELRLIEKAGAQIADFVERLSLAAEKGIYHFKKVDLSAVLEKVIKAQVHQLPHGLRVQHQVESDLPRVSGDAEKLEKALRALLINAFEACETRGDLVHVRLGVENASSIDPDELFWPFESQPHKLLSLSVEDNGCGVPEDVMVRIFDPFFTTKVPGRGLGLAMTAGVVKRHGGSIIIRSVQHKGATFSIFLPAE